MSAMAPAGGALERLVPRLTRLWPLYRGRGRLALSGLLRGRDAIAAEPVLSTLRTGAQIFVVGNDYIGRMVRFFGDLDPAVSDVVRRLLRPDDVVVDVGANVGIVALQAAGIVGPGGHVLAIEPVSLLSDLLARSAKLNGFDNLTVLRLAVSDVAGRASMDVPARSLGCATLRDDTTGERCEVTTLDDMARSRSLRRVRLLKVDVEGHESRVLAGGRAFFRESPPDYVLFESHAALGAFWDRREVRALREHGYRFKAILRSAFGRATLREVDSGGQAAEHTYDFLATQAGREA